MAPRDYLAEHLNGMAPHRAILRAVECKLMGSVELRAPVLDVGAGDGHFASIAYERPIDVGIDPLASDLSEAKTRSGVYRHLIRASATGLPFPEASFETVVSNSVLEHIPDLDSTLREISRVLRPGGSLAITTPSEHFPDLLLGSTVLRKIGGPRAGRLYG
ncbi:MAG: class I SAM-dependent methyltransferase, partial [Candidatus Binatia bacterium]